MLLFSLFQRDEDDSALLSAFSSASVSCLCRSDCCSLCWSIFCLSGLWFEVRATVPSHSCAEMEAKVTPGHARQTPPCLRKCPAVVCCVFRVQSKKCQRFIAHIFMFIYFFWLVSRSLCTMQCRGCHFLNNGHPKINLNIFRWTVFHVSGSVQRVLPRPPTPVVSKRFARKGLCPSFVT